MLGSSVNGQRGAQRSWKRRSLGWVLPRLLLLLLAAAIVVVACGGGDDPQPADPAPPGGTLGDAVDVTDRVQVSFSQAVVTTATATQDITATVRNISSRAILEPMSLVVSSIIPAVASLDNAFGISSEGHGFVRLPLIEGGLPPDQSVSAVLRFRNAGTSAVTFEYRVVGVLPEGNSPPIADAGPDQSVFVNDTVVLDGSGSSDRDGDRLTYSWRILSQPSESAAVLVNATSVRPSFEVDWPGTYEIELIVNDGEFDSAPDRAQISTLNSPPVADPGSDRTAFVGDTVTLDGSASHDVDGFPLTYRWDLIQAPSASTAALAAAEGVTTSLTIDRAGQYQVRLLVNDGFFDSAPAVVTISTVNSRPVADAGPDQSVSVGTTVQFDGTGSFDVDGDPLTYAWSVNAAPDGSTADIVGPTEVRPSIAPDVAGDYVIQLIVFDGELFSLPATLRLEVTAAPANADPEITSAPVLEAVVGQPYEYAVQASDPDGDPLTFNLGVAPTGMMIDSTTGLITWAPDTAGSAPVLVQVTDGRGGMATQDFRIEVAAAPVDPDPDLPPDPSSVAPAPDLTGATSTFAATSFLYSGENAIQTGVAPDTIVPQRAGVVRGRVLARGGQPLPGVRVTVLNHPELGETLSRADGWFDLAVNAGGQLTLNFERPGYLPAQRQVRVRWQEYAFVDDVILIQPDAKVTTIQLAGAIGMQAAQGSVVSDDDGSRTASLLIPAGTQALRYLPDGSTEPLQSLSLRFTEFTVGPEGPQTMPGPLPENVAYTYALEISADEAPVKINGRDVLFDRAVPFYVDNFLEFPIGTEVPMGYYDYDRAAWIPSDNGRVVRILDSVDGVAQLDVTGSGSPATAEELDALGIDAQELALLAQLYDDGTSLWRVPVNHLSTWDCNWPFGPPADAAGWLFDRLPSLWSDRREDCATYRGGSIIECENQTLGQRVPLVGVNAALNYRSDRVWDRAAARTIEIPLDDGTLPASLKRMEVQVTVAGRRIDLGTFAPVPGQTATFTWDGLDAYGRMIIGRRNATVTVAYIYDGEYQAPADGRAFGRSSGIAISGNRTRQEIYLTREIVVPVGVFDLSRAGIGGWTLDMHHVYEPTGRTLYYGDGGRRSVDGENSLIIETIAGIGGAAGTTGNDGPATEARLNSPYGVAVLPDGSILVAAQVVRRIDTDGIIRAFAGAGSGYAGDGGPATEALMRTVWDLAVAGDGSVYMAESDNHVIRRVDPDGIISTVAGTGGVSGFAGDGGPATEALLNRPRGVAVAADGSVYIVDEANRRIRRVGPDGIISTVVGTGGSGNSGDGGPATEATIGTIMAISLDTDGSLLLTVATPGVIRRVGPDGIITTIAGSGTGGFSGDGGPALEAQFGLPWAGAAAMPGSLFIPDRANHRIRRVGADGVVTTFAGSGSSTFGGFAGDGGPPAAARLRDPMGIAVAPDGSLIFGDSGNNRVRRIRSVFAGFNAAEIVIPSPDGRLLYRFNPEGRHLETYDSQLGIVLYSFTYDDDGYLLAVEDNHGNQITIERGADRVPTALVGPFGHSTTVTVNEAGYLAGIVNPAGEAVQLSYTPQGLLTAYTNPNGHTATYVYDDLGRLQSATDASGVSQTLARNATLRGHDVSHTTTLDETTQYSVESLASGAQRRRVVTPDGAESITDTGPDGHIVATSADGTSMEVTTGPDPRFAGQAPVPLATTLTAGQRTLEVQRSVSVAGADPSDPLSFNSLTRTLTINGNTRTSAFTQATRREDRTSAAGRQQYTVFDLAGRVVESGAGALLPQFQSYDDFGRLVSVTDGEASNARVTEFDYDADGRLSVITNALGQSRLLGYDAAGRVNAITLADDTSIAYEYGAAGNLTAFSAPDRPQHRFEYDAANRLLAYLPPEVDGLGNTVTTYSYDANGRISSMTRPDEQVVSYSWDAAGRLAASTSPLGTYQFSYELGTGQLSAIAAPGDVDLAFTHDQSLMTAVQWSGALQGRVDFDYDNDFRISSIAVNQQSPVDFGYDADGLLTVAGDLSLTRDNGHGFVTAAILGELSENFVYNDRGELTDYELRHDDEPLLQFSYAYDELGRIAEAWEVADGSAVTLAYSYDAVGQLVGVQRNGSVDAAYSYDGNGNRLTRIGTDGTENGMTDEQDRLLTYAGASFAYTANGELLSREDSLGTTSYIYDVAGNLRGVTLADGTQIEYLIDGHDRRVGKRVDGLLVQGWLYQDQFKPVAELDGDGNLTSQFVYATNVNVPDYMIRDGETYRIVTDQIGSVRLVINASDGTIAQQLVYDGFGRVLVDTNPGFQPFGFAGGLYDVDTGLVRFGARDYDSFTGRWTAKDPIGLAGGDTNLYRYALNDPANRLDVSGFSSQFEAFANAASQYITTTYARHLVRRGMQRHYLWRTPFANRAIERPLVAQRIRLVNSINVGTGAFIGGMSVGRDVSNLMQDPSLGTVADLIGSGVGLWSGRVALAYMGGRAAGEAIVGDHTVAAALLRLAGFCDDTIAETLRHW